MGNLTPFIVLGVIYLVMRLIANRAGQDQKGPAPPPAGGPPAKPTVGRQPAGTIEPGARRPIAEMREPADGGTWTAPQEQIDRFLRRSPDTMPRMPEAGPSTVPPAIPGPQVRPVPPAGPPSVGQPQRPTSPLAQILQIPEQIAVAQRTAALAEQQMAEHRAQIERQESQLREQRQVLDDLRRQLRRQAAAARPVSRPAAQRAITLTDPADLRRAIVLAEVLGPPKALRHKRPPRAGMV